MGVDSGSVYVFVEQENETWEELQKRTPKDREAVDLFGVWVAISGGTSGFGSIYDEEWVINSGSVYVYTNISGKWIEKGKIFPEGGADNEYSGYIVSILGSTSLFGAPDNWAEENGGSAYVVDLFVTC